MYAGVKPVHMGRTDEGEASLRGEDGSRPKSTPRNREGTAMTLKLRTLIEALMAAVLLSDCGEPISENASSQNSLIEDQQACAVEVAKSPAALA